MILEEQTEVSLGIEDRGQRTFHEGEVFAARQLFETKRLLHVPDQHRTEVGNILHPDVLILDRDIATGEIKLGFEYDPVIEITRHAEPCSAELDTFTVASDPRGIGGVVDIHGVAQI